MTVLFHFLVPINTGCTEALVRGDYGHQTTIYYVNDRLLDKGEDLLPLLR